MRLKISVVIVVVLWAIAGIFAQDVPSIVNVMSGEVTDTSAVLWAKASTSGTVTFNVFAPDNDTALFSASVAVDDSSDFIAKVRATDLLPHTLYRYQAYVGEGEAVEGTFKTAPASDEAQSVRFTFASCIGGQGYCRPEEGWTIFETMLAQSPDFFLITGDTVYSTGACPSDAGQNVSGSELPANTLAEFRNRYAYQLQDAIYGNFLANVPTYVTWDDHEIADNFSAAEWQRLNPQRYQAGRQAFFEYWTLLVGELDVEEPFRLYRRVPYGALAELFILDTRSYRDPIVNWDTHPRTGVPKTMLGAEQLAWLRESLASSTATWKFVVSSVPLAFPTGFPQPEVEGRDGWANNGERSGYETELLSLFYFVEANDIENVIFLSGDTHFPFALSYDPDRDGTPNLYEFSASPLSAIPLAPVPADQTFNPTVLYAEGEFRGTLFNFGVIDIQGEDGTLTFKVVDREGVERYALTLSPRE